MNAPGTACLSDFASPPKPKPSELDKVFAGPVARRAAAQLDELDALRARSAGSEELLEFLDGDSGMVSTWLTLLRQIEGVQHTSEDSEVLGQVPYDHAHIRQVGNVICAARDNLVAELAPDSRRRLIADTGDCFAQGCTAAAVQVKLDAILRPLEPRQD